MMLKKIILLLIYKYQKTETSLHARCRYTPTCSEYMALSIEKYGVIKGVTKGIRRLLRCHYPNCGEDWP